MARHPEQLGKLTSRWSWARCRDLLEGVQLGHIDQEFPRWKKSWQSSTQLSEPFSKTFKLIPVCLIGLSLHSSPSVCLVNHVASTVEIVHMASHEANGLKGVSLVTKIWVCARGRKRHPRRRSRGCSSSTSPGWDRDTARGVPARGRLPRLQMSTPLHLHLWKKGKKQGKGAKVWLQLQASSGEKNSSHWPRKGRKKQVAGWKRKKNTPPGDEGHPWWREQRQ